jgi:hypothetical protein
MWAGAAAAPPPPAAALLHCAPSLTERTRARCHCPRALCPRAAAPVGPHPHTRVCGELSSCATRHADMQPTSNCTRCDCGFVPAAPASWLAAAAHSSPAAAASTARSSAWALATCAQYITSCAPFSSLILLPNPVTPLLPAVAATAHQGGESHGFAKVFDGDVTTYFDCFGGVDDIKSDCWVGLELTKPSAVSTIRYYPRGSCAGCQTGGNPACGTSADKGGCRMSGGKFQGAEAAAGPWIDLATISTTAAVAEGRWTSISSQNSHTYSHVRYMSAPLGFCNVAEVVSTCSVLVL